MYGQNPEENAPRGYINNGALLPGQLLRCCRSGCRLSASGAPHLHRCGLDVTWRCRLCRHHCLWFGASLGLNVCLPVLAAGGFITIQGTKNKGAFVADVIAPAAHGDTVITVGWGVMAGLLRKHGWLARGSSQLLPPAAYIITFPAWQLSDTSGLEVGQYVDTAWTDVDGNFNTLM